MKVGIGFITGRKSFQKVLRTNIFSWKESGLTADEEVSLHVFVAYDLKYMDTKKEDYTNINKELRDEIDSVTFIGRSFMEEEVAQLEARHIITGEDTKVLFGTGYAAKRNAIVYKAIRQGMDCLIFLDDDEYPMAVTNTRQRAIWSGQFVLAEHLKNISNADMTHGYHCGYISPIPYLEFNEVLTQRDFQRFIEAISNDILNWENILGVMQNGGVTYADIDVLTSQRPVEAEELHGAKFISGSNLCLNLTQCRRVFPFYNPPGARGEDTFLSTCLSQRKVLRVPCYNFHDGFLTYRHLLEGVLPIHLKFIRGDSEAVVTRFYKACVGWIRYKPLLVYTTDRAHFEERMSAIERNLVSTLPQICDFFEAPAFMGILYEFLKYRRNVKKHAENFSRCKNAWGNIMEALEREIETAHPETP